MGVAERIAAAGFGQLPSQNLRFHLYFREPYLTLVEAATGQIGSVMVMTERGPAAIQWPGDPADPAMLAGRGFEEPAQAGILDGAKRFTADLTAALRGITPGIPTPD